MKQGIKLCLVAVFISACFLQKLSAAEPDFTFVVVPDSQYMVQKYWAVWDSLIHWVIDHKTEQNIQAVLTVGDITNNANDVQFSSAVIGYNQIAAAGLPIVPILGNHDYDASAPINRLTVKFDQYFGPNKFSGQSWYKGNYNGSDDDYFVQFMVGPRKFLILALEVFPRPAAVAWASGIIDSNPESEVIVLTHGFLSSDGTRLADASAHGPGELGLPAADNSGEDLWNNLIKTKKNVRAVFCGHVSFGPMTAHRSDPGTNGNTIHQIFNDYQNSANGGDGWIGLLKFRPSNSTAEMSYYRTYAPSGLGFDPLTPTFSLSWPVVDFSPPTVPANVAAVSVSSTQINLSWSPSSDNFGVSGYGIFRDGIQIATSTTPGCSDGGRSPSTVYVYTVTAFDSLPNISAPSAPLTVTTLARPPVPISKISAADISSASARVTWSTDPVPALTQLEYGLTVSYGSSSPKEISPSTDHAQILTGLQPGTLYHYRIHAADAFETTTVSSDQTFQTQSAAPTPTPPSTPPPVSTPTPTPAPAAAPAGTYFNLFINTFNPSRGETAAVSYNIDSFSHVTLEIYDVKGRLIRTLVDGNGDPTRNPQTAAWDGRNSENSPVAPDVYLLILKSNGAVQTKKVVVLR